MSIFLRLGLNCCILSFLLLILETDFATAAPSINKTKEALFGYIKTHDVANVRRILQQNCPYNLGQALHYALEEDRKEIVALLIAKGAFNECFDEDLDHTWIIDTLVNTYSIDLNRIIPSRSFGLPLIAATISERKEAVKKLLTYGANPNIKNEHAHVRPLETPLEIAVSTENTELCSILLDHGADPTTNALITAAERGLVKFIVKCIDKIDINLPNEKGITPLMKASHTGNLLIVKLLVEKGANIHYVHPKFGSALTLAYRHPDIIQYLLENGADVNPKTESNQTPLTTPLLEAVKNDRTIFMHTLNRSTYKKEGANSFVEASHHDTSVIKMLIQNRANVNAQYNIEKSEWSYKNSPLIFATIAGNKTVVQYLIRHGANLVHSNDYGLTPILCAIQYNHQAILKLLLESVHNVNLICEETMIQIPPYKKRRHWTALHHAVIFQNKEAIKILLRYHANVNIQDGTCVTPYELSLQENQEEIAAIIEKHINHSCKIS